VLAPAFFERKPPPGEFVSYGFQWFAISASGLFGVIGPVNFSTTTSSGAILSTGCASRFTVTLAGVLAAFILEHGIRRERR
jgi:hypothetical protein